MAQDEIGVGIIGTGFGVRVQLSLWQHTPGARVTAVCSHDAVYWGTIPSTIREKSSGL